MISSMQWAGMVLDLLRVKARKGAPGASVAAPSCVPPGLPGRVGVGLSAAAPRIWLPALVAACLAVTGWQINYQPNCESQCALGSISFQQLED